MLRYTPAGIPVVEFKLQHESTQNEAGLERRVQCHFNCICLGKEALAIAALDEGVQLLVKGFFAARHQRYKANLVLHVARWKAAPSTPPPVI
ncbi:primosomal replication protein N [Chitinimonas sp.]|uniref:primosomal replication protein N n=1 Tax=Chitinimonas sp. TaxID=1934313 RepID=UPI0035B32FA7